MTRADFVKVSQMVYDTTAYLPWAMALGTATTIGGGYLAARIAKSVPYYHGLAMGVRDRVHPAVRPADARWLAYLAILVTIPVSL